MREIKFRAWDKDDKIMRTQEAYGGIAGLFQLAKRFAWILLQFTGLKDKNGKEIFEGDIVEYKIMKNYAKYKVIWNNGNWGWTLERIDYEGYSSVGHVAMREVKVIGNIYKNPELLEEETNG